MTWDARHGPVRWRPAESFRDRLRHCGRLRTSPYSPDWKSSMFGNAEEEEEYRLTKVGCLYVPKTYVFDFLKTSKSYLLCFKCISSSRESKRTRTSISVLACYAVECKWSRSASPRLSRGWHYPVSCDEVCSVQLAFKGAWVRVANLAEFHGSLLPCSRGVGAVRLANSDSTQLLFFWLFARACMCVCACACLCVRVCVCDWMGGGGGGVEKDLGGVNTRGVMTEWRPATCLDQGALSRTTVNQPDRFSYGSWRCKVIFDHLSHDIFEAKSFHLM